ncbi:ABC transporter permease, partial [Escherichia coli]
RWWGRGELLGISIPIWIFAIVAIGGYLALHKTRWGRFVYAIGGNPEAARLAGVNVKRVLVSVYVLIGCLAGLAGFILSARLGSAEAVAGISFELRVIASVVIGGTSLMGGYGRIGGTIIGSIIMGILINGLVLMNVSAYYQQIITGLIIVLAVAFDTYAKSRRGAL